MTLDRKIQLAISYARDMDAMFQETKGRGARRRLAEICSANAWLRVRELQDWQDIDRRTENSE